MTPASGQSLAGLLDGVVERDIGVPPPVVRIVEAMLFASEKPLSAHAACQVVRGLSPEQFQSIVETLGRDYRRQNRPYGVHVTESGYAIAVKPAYRQTIERLRGGPRATKLSPAALDTLAVVAYRQPVSRAEVDTLRGQDSSANLRLLVRLGLAVVTASGKESHYSTTPQFLQLFGLTSLDDMPQTLDFHSV